MSVLFIGKRFYTNRDALREHYGRIYQLPWHWAQAGIETRLWLVDYHTLKPASERDGALEIVSTPVRNAAVFRRYLVETRAGQRTNAPPMVVVASGDCYIGLLGYRLAKHLGARFVFDVYDKYDEFGGYRRLPGFDPFQFLLRWADARLFASRALMEQAGVDLKPNFLAPNGIDTQRFRPLDKSASRRALDLPDDGTILVGYFGGMTPDRGVNDLISAVRALRVEGKNIELVLGGKARFGMDFSMPWVHYLGNMPYSSVPVAMASADVLALPYRNSRYLDMASSCKIAEYIACARPIVATRTPNFLANFPAQAKELGSSMVEPGDTANLAKAIIVQCTNKLLVHMPVGFDWSSIANDLATELKL